MRLVIYALFFSSILSQSTQPFYKDGAQREVFIKYAGIISTVFSSAEINENSMKELFLLIPIIISQAWTQCLVIITIADKDKNRTIPDLYIYTLYCSPRTHRLTCVDIMLVSISVWSKCCFKLRFKVLLNPPVCAVP